MAARADIPLSEHVASPARFGSTRRRRLDLWTALRAAAFGFCDDSDLVRRALYRDRAAFVALVARYRGRIRKLAHKQRGIADPEAEALRDLLLYALHDIDSFCECCSPGTWLYLHGFSAAFALLSAAAHRHSSERRIGIRVISPTGW